MSPDGLTRVSHLSRSFIGGLAGDPVAKDEGANIQFLDCPELSNLPRFRVLKAFDHDQNIQVVVKILDREDPKLQKVS